MKKLKIWEIIDFIFISGIGTLLHYTYEWSGNNEIVGFFSAVNESTWEHLKLLFFPALLFAIVEYIYIGKVYTGFFTSKAFAIILGMLSIVTLVYTYQGVIGKDIMFLNILIFFIGALVTAFVSYKIMPKNRICDIIGIILLVSISGCFFIFTSNPPSIALFQNP